MKTVIKYIIERRDGTLIQAKPQDWPSDAFIHTLTQNGVLPEGMSKTSFIRLMKKQGYKVVKVRVIGEEHNV